MWQAASNQTEKRAMADSNAYLVTKKFESFLKDEEMSSEKRKIDHVLERYKDHPGSLIPVLQYVQKEIGYLPSVVQDYVALGLNVPSSDVYGVVSFYSFFTMVPRGDHVIRVCLGTACYVKGGNKILANLEKGLGVKEGETTADRKFSLEVVRCLGACGLAPVVVVDEDTHGQLDPKHSMEIAESYIRQDEGQ